MDLLNAPSRQPPADDDPCPCGSDRLLAGCCLPFIRGEQDAPTPEALMRSRYASLLLSEFAYLTNTQTRECTEQSPPGAVETWNAGITWRRLEVLNAEGYEDSAEGTVEFRAHYSECGFEKIHHEHSAFRREGDRWVYSGVIKRRLLSPSAAETSGEVKARRNDPCPCGSGKKYKKCCLAAAS